MQQLHHQAWPTWPVRSQTVAAGLHAPLAGPQDLPAGLNIIASILSVLVRVDANAMPHGDRQFWIFQVARAPGRSLYIGSHSIHLPMGLTGAESLKSPTPWTIPFRHPQGSHLDCLRRGQRQRSARRMYPITMELASSTDATPSSLSVTAAVPTSMAATCMRVRGKAWHIMGVAFHQNASLKMWHDVQLHS